MKHKIKSHTHILFNIKRGGGGSKSMTGLWEKHLTGEGQIDWKIRREIGGKIAE